MTAHTEPLGERQGQILIALVREYIDTADPVGSKHLVGKFHLAVSSATVRNDMAKLEELGYLAQPHASAGRIPTDLGYRFFVDSEPAAKLGVSNRKEIEHVAAGDPADMESLLRRANEILSRTMGLASAAITPRLRTSRLKHLDLAWLSSKRAVLVLVADGGRVEKRVIELDVEIDELTLESIGAALNRMLSGRSVADAERDARLAGAEKVPPADAKTASVARALASALESLLGADQDVVVGGAANLATAPDFARVEQLARVFDVFERRIPLHQALSDATSPASVRIGAEVPVDDLHACSVVVAPFSENAAIGIIGPTRMEYPRVIAAVSLMARMLDDAVEDLS